MIENIIETIEGYIFNSVGPKNKEYSILDASINQATYVAEFLSMELQERVFLSEFDYIFLFDEKNALYDLVNYFRTNKRNIYFEHNLARKQLANPEAAFISSRNKNAADNVFPHESALVNMNKNFCNAILEEIDSLERTYKYVNTKENKPKYALIREGYVRNDILNRIFKTRDAFENFQERKINLKARMIRNIQQYEENLRDVLRDRNFSTEFKNQLKEELTIKFPHIPSEREFDEFSTKETEYQFIKANNIFGFSR